MLANLAPFEIVVATKQIQNSRSRYKGKPGIKCSFSDAKLAVRICIETI